MGSKPTSKGANVGRWSHVPSGQQACKFLTITVWNQWHLCWCPDKVWSYLLCIHVSDFLLWFQFIVYPKNNKPFIKTLACELIVCSGPKSLWATPVRNSREFTVVRNVQVQVQVVRHGEWMDGKGVLIVDFRKSWLIFEIDRKSDRKLKVEWTNRTAVGLWHESITAHQRFSVDIYQGVTGEFC